MVAALLKHGAAVNTRCLQGWTALQEAVCRNNVEICELLLQAGAKLSVTNAYGIAPLFSAAQSGQLAALRFLLKHGGYRRNVTGHSGSKSHFTQTHLSPRIRCCCCHTHNQSALSGGRVGSTHPSWLTLRGRVHRALITCCISISTCSVLGAPPPHRCRH